MYAFFEIMSTGAFSCDAVDSLKFSRVGLTYTLNQATRALEKDGKRHNYITENMFGIYVIYGRSKVLSRKSLCAGV